MSKSAQASDHSPDLSLPELTRLAICSRLPSIAAKGGRLLFIARQAQWQQLRWRQFVKDGAGSQLRFHSHTSPETDVGI